MEFPTYRAAAAMQCGNLNPLCRGVGVEPSLQCSRDTNDPVASQQELQIS